MLIDIISSYLEFHIETAKLSLLKNNISNPMEKERLISDIVTMYNSINKGQSAQKCGMEMQCRPSYTAFQYIIEKSLCAAKIDKKINDLSCFIIAPNPPTPLMTINCVSNLRRAKINDKLDIASIRYESLTQMLELRCNVTAVFLSRSSSSLQNDLSFEYFQDHVINCDYLHSHEIKGIDLDTFPGELTGAIYKADGEFITVESRQLNQVGDVVRLSTVEPHEIENEIQINYKPKSQFPLERLDDPVLKWSVAIGNEALPRVTHVQKFLDDNALGSVLQI